MLVKRRKHIALVNLKRCFPDLTDTEHHELLKRTFDNFGAGLIETAMGWWSDEKVVHKLIECEGVEHVHEAAARGKGVVLIGAHFSSLDLAPMIANKYFRAHAVHREQKNQLVNHILVNGRASSLLSVISNRDSRKILRTILGGGIVWLAPDHDMGEKLSVYAPFFDQLAATVTVTGRYVKKTGASAVFFSHHRNSDNTGYKARFTLLPESFAAMDDIAGATLVNKTIADHIRIDPAQYYWFHRRFKTQPGLPRASLYLAARES